jgi:hypothetical protein
MKLQHTIKEANEAVTPPLSNEKVDAREVAAKMKTNKDWFGPKLAAAVAKRGKVSHADLDKMLPDFIPGGVIASLFSFKKYKSKHHEHTIREDIITEGGDELDFDDLDSKQQVKIKAAQKVIGGKRAYIMESIHGLIVGFEDIRALSGNKTIRFSDKDLAQFAKLKLRWLDVSPSQQMVAVGI